MTYVASLFSANTPNHYEENFPEHNERYASDPSLVADHSKRAARHRCNQFCARNCRLLIANSYANIQSTLPNNRDGRVPILIESKLNPANLRLSSEPRTSNFSNFRNYKAWLDSLERERSKYFDVYHPNGEKTALKSSNSVCDSWGSSQSLSSTDGNRSDSGSSSPNSTVFNLTALQQPNCPPQQPRSIPIKEEIKNFNLHHNPIQFNMDKVQYVKTLARTKTIIETVINRCRVIALNLDSDCCLQDGVDLLEVAVMSEMSLDHPEIFVFDTYLEPRIIDLFKPVFANARIIKVMFDPRFALRILCRKYGVSEFLALFDIQLAYRFLLAKKTDCRLEDIKREKLLYVSWQCNGPMANIEKLLQPPTAGHLKNRPFWKARPVNFDIMYKAAYEVFVMVPQLFTNLMVIMERTIGETDHTQFIKRSNELISRNLVPRKFAFFRTKQQYLGEMHKQIDLLIQSDILFRNRQQAAKGQLTDEDYSSGEHSDGLDSIDDTGTDSYKSYNSTEDLMSSANDDLIYFTDGHQSECAENESESGHELSDDGQFDNFETFGEHLEEPKAVGAVKPPGKPAVCEKCQLPIEKNHNRLGELIEAVETDGHLLNRLLFNGGRNQQFCRCIADGEVKCMNLLVDQIIDLAECKEDYMELDE